MTSGPLIYLLYFPQNAHLSRSRHLLFIIACELHLRHFWCNELNLWTTPMTNWKSKERPNWDTSSSRDHIIIMVLLNDCSAFICGHFGFQAVRFVTKNLQGVPFWVKFTFDHKCLNNEINSTSMFCSTIKDRTGSGEVSVTNRQYSHMHLVYRTKANFFHFLFPSAQSYIHKIKCWLHILLGPWL